MGLLSKPLRPYSGPYQVATIDLEIPVNHQRYGTATLISTNEPALQLDSSLFTIFYPAATSPHHQRLSSQKQLPWLQRPLSVSAAGYAHFLGNKPQWVIKLALWLLASGTYLPAPLNKPLANFKSSMSTSAEKAAAATMATTSSTERSATDTLVGEDDVAQLSAAKNRFPTILFSHGLGGNRTIYSEYCGNLAAQGNVVVAVEHRDGTAPVSVVRLKNESSRRGYDERQILYIKPEDIKFDPPHRKLSQLEHRSEQLEMRLAEIQSCLQVLGRINDGQGTAIVAENLRHNDSAATELAHWQGRLDLDDCVTMTGHSFGGATTLQVLRAGSTQFPSIQRGIALDPWIDPIPPFEARTHTTAKPSAEGEQKHREGLDIVVPLLVINSEAFTLWRPHYKLVRDIVENVKDGQAWFMTLCGSIHLSFSDFPLIQPFIAKKAGARVDPNKAMSLFAQASTEFLADSHNPNNAGAILGRDVVPGDERGTRPGEGDKTPDGKGRRPMEPAGEMRLHYRPPRRVIDGASKLKELEERQRNESKL